MGHDHPDDTTDEQAPWYAGLALIVAGIGATIISGALLGLFGAVAYTVFRVLTGSLR